MNVFRGNERDWTEQYAIIGEFVSEFEMICFKMRFLVCALLQNKGLKDWRLSEVILNQRCFTAEPLNTLLESCIGHLLSDNNEIITLSKEFRTAFQELSKRRNDLLHSTWLIGSSVTEVTDNDVPTEVYSEKRTPNSKGHRVTIIASSVEDIRKDIIEAKRIRELFDSLNLKVMQATFDELE